MPKKTKPLTAKARSAGMRPYKPHQHPRYTRNTSQLEEMDVGPPLSTMSPMARTEAKTPGGRRTCRASGPGLINLLRSTAAHI